jgi:hypothetical protein
MMSRSIGVVCGFIFRQVFVNSSLRRDEWENEGRIDLEAGYPELSQYWQPLHRIYETPETALRRPYIQGDSAESVRTRYLYMGTKAAYRD